MNIRENRPEVQESSLRIADYYRQHGVGTSELAPMTATVLGGFVRSEAVAQGIQRGFQFLSLYIAGLGLMVVFLLVTFMRAGPLPGTVIADK